MRKGGAFSTFGDVFLFILIRRGLCVVCVLYMAKDSREYFLHRKHYVVHKLNRDLPTNFRTCEGIERGSCSCRHGQHHDEHGQHHDELFFLPPPLQA